MLKMVGWDGVYAEYDEEELVHMAALRAAGDVEALKFVHLWKSIDPGARLRDERVNISELAPQPEWRLTPDPPAAPQNDVRGPRRRRHEPLDGQVSFL